MSKIQIPSRFSITMAIIAFIAAAVPAFGLVMKEDRVGRAIFTAVWILVGIGWLGHFIVKKAKT